MYQSIWRLILASCTIQLSNWILCHEISPPISICASFHPSNKRRGPRFGSPKPGASEHKWSVLMTERTHECRGNSIYTPNKRNRHYFAALHVFARETLAVMGGVDDIEDFYELADGVSLTLITPCLLIQCRNMSCRSQNTVYLIIVTNETSSYMIFSHIDDH